ncbi:TPM domain-containing protein [Streptomyces sp. NPDC006704]|uniref:TPM domain-containing protein n=1 Tax=Streptomyces sp. NPDC006704 TaxID=3364760 RepID=UPI0036B33547
MTPPVKRARHRAATQRLTVAMAYWSSVVSGTGTAHAAGPHGVPHNSGSDFILPIGVVVVVCALAAYAYLKRKRRTHSRTTPGGSGAHPEAVPPAAPFDVLDDEARAALVATDEAVRTSAEELDFARAESDAKAVGPFTGALTHARSELATAFRLRQELDEGRPEDESARRGVLAEMTARCDGAGRCLDAEADAFDRLRALDQDPARAIASAEAAFRELTTRTGAAERTLTGLLRQYAPSASAPVAGFIEEAKDRLVLATTSLNAARQALDAGDRADAAAQVRIAEGAVHQTGVLADAVERRGRALAEAAELLPPLLTACDDQLADQQAELDADSARQERIARARSVLAGVREESGAGPHDPLDASRRAFETAGADAGDAAAPRGRALLDSAVLTARAAIDAADAHIATHGGAVGCRARTRLAAARAHLAQLPDTGSDAPGALSSARAADALAREALDHAEQDVAAYRTPGLAGGAGDGGPVTALAGGIVLESPATDGSRRPGGPPGFGGPATRARRHPSIGPRARRAP